MANIPLKSKFKQNTNARTSHTILTQQFCKNVNQWVGFSQLFAVASLDSTNTT